MADMSDSDVPEVATLHPAYLRMAKTFRLTSGRRRQKAS